jgi:hypothetical protein
MSSEPPSRPETEAKRLKTEPGPSNTSSQLPVASDASSSLGGASVIASTQRDLVIDDSDTGLHRPPAAPPRPIDASPPNPETKSRSETTLGLSDSESGSNLNLAITAPARIPVEETNYRMSASKPASYAKQKLQSGGYGYHSGSSPYITQAPAAKRQAVARKMPRRPLPKIPDRGGSTILTPFGGMPRKGVREHTVSLRLEHVQKTLRPLLLKFMQVSFPTLTPATTLKKARHAGSALS